VIAGPDQGIVYKRDRASTSGRALRVGFAPNPGTVLGKTCQEDLMDKRNPNEDGKAGWLFLWLLGVPIPILLLLFLLRGCT
jgi:hypothetical protein